MDVGQVSADHTTFDISNFDETNSVITTTHNVDSTVIKWIYKDLDNRAIMLTKTIPRVNTYNRGTKLHVSRFDGCAEPKHPHDTEDNVVGRLAVDVDFANNTFAQKTVTDSNGVQAIAYYIPVILK